MVYDETGQQIEVEDAEQRRTTSVFDGVGRMTALVDANARRTTFQYNAAGNKTVETDPLLRRTTYSYDNVGRPTVKHDARDNRITTVYDAGRPIRKELPAGVRHTLGYDSLNRQTLLADPTGRYTTTFDERGLATKVENPNGKTIEYAYDALGRRDYMIDPDGGRTTYSYDEASRMTDLENPLNERTTWTYDNLGSATQQRLANGTRATYTFDPAGQLTRLANVKSDDAVISTFDYSYDDVGNRTAVTESSGDLVTWSYDKTYQLTREQRDGANSYDVTHTYDPVGNRLVKNDGGSLTTSTYDDANQLATSEDSSGTTTYTYDATGNLKLQKVHDGTRTTNTWDVENRLTLVEAPSNVVNTMTYRADGLRVEKEDGTSTSKFIWDGQNILTETDGNDDTQAVYTLKPAAYGNLLSQRRKEGELWVPHFFHFDALGSTSELTDINESASDSYIYRAYGKQVANIGNTINPFRWVGRLGYFEDAELEQYYVRARHYSPGLARWLSEDPIGYESGVNRYAFCSANPIKWSDPLGLKAEGEVHVVVFSQNYGSSLFESYMKLLWNAPESWRKSTNAGCLCSRVGWYQIAKTHEIFVGGLYVLTPRNKPWHVDDRLGMVIIDWVHGSGIEDDPPPGTIAKNGWFARLTDTPGFGTYPSFNYLLGYLQTLDQHFESCAICMDKKSDRYLEVFGCVNWSHNIWFDLENTNEYHKINSLKAPYNKSITHVQEGHSPGDNSQQSLRLQPTAGAAPSYTYLKLIRKDLGNNVRW